MKFKNAHWNEDDNRRLKEAVEAGVSAARAAVMFKRTIPAIRGQARKIGTPFPTLLESRRVQQAKIDAATKTSGL